MILIKLLENYALIAVVGGVITLMGIASYKGHKSGYNACAAKYERLNGDLQRGVKEQFKKVELDGEERLKGIRNVKSEDNSVGDRMRFFIDSVQ